MTQQVAQLLAEALRLSEAERGDLAARLIESLDPGVAAAVEQTWSEEVRNRIAELDTGAVRPVPWPEARQRIMEDGDDSVEP